MLERLQKRLEQLTLEAEHAAGVLNQLIGARNELLKHIEDAQKAIESAVENVVKQHRKTVLRGQFK